MKVFDVHSHFLVDGPQSSPDAARLGYSFQYHSIEEHLAFMDRIGIDYTLLSCPTQKYLDDPASCADYCKALNDTAAEIAARYPDRFGFAATLPMLCTDEALKELERAVSLGARGVGLCSNYNGVYPGDEKLHPIFEAVGETGLPMTLHPASPLNFPQGPITGKILPMFEFIADSTRALLNMFAAQTLNRCPGLKIVVPHAGSCLPPALERFMGIYGTRNNIQVPLDRLWFDLACDSFPRGVPILLTLTDTSHIVYGTDYPAIPEFVLNTHIQNAKECPELIAAGAVEDVMWNNARALFGF